MKLNKTIITTILTLLIVMSQGTELFAQKIKHFQQEYSITNKRAIKKFETGEAIISVNRKNWMAGLALVSEAIEMEPEFVEAHILVARTYEKMNMGGKYNNKIMKHYKKVAELRPDDPSFVSTYLKMAEYSFKKGKYESCLEYIELIEKYKLASENIFDKSQLIKENANFAMISMMDSVSFEPVPLSRETINRYAHNSHPVLTADESEMVISVRNNKGFTDENILWARKKDGRWQPAESISTEINSPKNEGMASISGDGKTLVFASVDRAGGYGSGDLYVSYRTGDTWGKPINLGARVNTEHMETEPSISADGRTIYFSCDRPGGFGGRDIWYTKRDENNVWQSPDNVGADVNSPQWEVTPFIHADGQTLYFASRGHQGLGGYDIFYSKLKGGTWAEPTNLGYPVNTPKNEGSLFVTPDYKTAYYEQYTKKGRVSHSEIYSFDVPEELKQEFRCVYAKGTIFDGLTKEMISADIELIDLKNGKTNQWVTSDSVSGNYLLVLTAGKEYALHVRKDGYLFHSIHFDYTGTSSFDPVMLDIYLQPLSSKKAVTLRNIFFESGKYELKSKSSIELDKFVTLLEANPEVKIEISGHTDNVGGTSSNQTLSTNRAKAVHQYLVNKGIDNSRLTYKGYGASKPQSNNNTKEGRAKNRRIDIRVIN